MSIVKIAGISLISVVISLILKQLKPEFGIFIPITAGAVIFIYALSEFMGIIQLLTEKATEYGLNNEYMTVLFKSLGIAYITQFATDCCKDSGESAIASKVEFCGKIMIISCAVPVMFSVLDMIDRIIALI